MRTVNNKHARRNRQGMSTSNVRPGQWAIQTETVYCSERAEKLHRAFGIIAPEAEAPRVNRKKTRKEHQHEPTRRLVCQDQ